MAKRLSPSAKHLGHGLGYGPRSGIRRSRLNCDSSLAYRLRYDTDPEYRRDFDSKYGPDDGDPEYRLDDFDSEYDSEYGPDDGDVVPQASRPLQRPYRRFTSLDVGTIIALHETVPLLRDMCEKAAREDARMEWPAETTPSSGRDLVRVRVRVRVRVS